jgi:DNA-binding CsgD family transcriptional regulator
MSTEPSKDTEKAISAVPSQAVSHKSWQEKHPFWGLKRNRDIFNLFKNGKSIEDIATTLEIKPDTVINVVTNDYFRARLDKYLAAKVYMFQTSSIIALDDISKRLWEKVRLSLDDIAPEICLKELTRLISMKPNQSKVINPKQYNVVINDSKDATEMAKEMVGKILDDDFGFEPLPDKPDSEYHTYDATPTTPEP